MGAIDPIQADRPGGAPRHPLFARLYAYFCDPTSDPAEDAHRRETLAGLSGRVIEVGAGHGVNFPYYGPPVTEVLAVEPEPYLRGRAQAAISRTGARVSVVDGSAEALPAGDASFDAGVISLVLCSVPDPDRALAELHRVIRPGGELRYYEHVVADLPSFARLQRLADRLFWPCLTGGCHASRDTRAAIERAGFRIERHRAFRYLPMPLTHLVLPHILGVARRP